MKEEAVVSEASITGPIIIGGKDAAAVE